MTTIQPSQSLMVGASPRDYLVLIKPGVLSLVLFSAMIGMALAPGAGSLHPLYQLLALLAIAFGSASGAAFNMIYDRDIDAIMKRTQRRPLVTGAIAPGDAWVFAIGLGVASVAFMGLAANWQAAALLAFSIFFYAVVYTVWLKRHTAQNIVIGGAAGAFPPVIGWMAVTGDAMAVLPWMLFLIVFLWTPPHFWALALYRNDDYRKANIPMLPVIAGKKATKWQMLCYTLVLMAVTLATPLLSAQLGVISLVSAALLSGGFVLHSLRVLRSDNDKIAMKMFGYSILYLFALLAAFGIDGLLSA